MEINTQVAQLTTVMADRLLSVSASIETVRKEDYTEFSNLKKSTNVQLNEDTKLIMDIENSYLTKNYFWRDMNIIKTSLDSSSGRIDDLSSNYNETRGELNQLEKEINIHKELAK